MVLSDYLKSLKGKKAAVIGVGVSNLPLIKMLLNSGVQVIARDKKSMDKFGAELNELIEMGMLTRFGEDYLSELEEDIIFRTPGLTPNTPELLAAVKKGSELTSEMEVFFKVCPCPIIAVTGSDGKTTTTTVISEILRQAGYTVHLGGNIGNPLLADIPEIKPSDYAVLELSSFQLMTMDRSPQVAVVTNIGPNHLDYHTDMEEYVAAKMKIFLNQKSGDLLVINSDNEITSGFADRARGRVRNFSRRVKPANGFYFDGEEILLIENGKEAPVIARKNVRLFQLHNIENIMAAFCAVYDIAGLEACKRVTETFSGVEHRMEFVRELNGAKYYNVSIASSPSRTIADLSSFDQKVILIAGGKDKNVPYDALGPVVREKVKVLVLTGPTGPKIKEAVLKADNGECPEIIEEAEFENAVKTAASHAQDGDIVILSPASTSFDRFKDFAERGNYFKELVNKL